MITPYTPAKDIILLLTSYIEDCAITCANTFNVADDETKPFVHGQLQAFNLMYNLLTTIIAVPEPEVVE